MDRRAILVVVSIAFAACSSQGGSSSGVVVMNGCRVDPARICDAIRDKPVVMSNTGLTGDSHMVEQSGARTANIFLPVKMPNGVEIFQVECGINTLNRSVSWAHIMTGPPVTDEDAKFLRDHNYCSEP